MEYPHWLMVTGAVLVVFGFVGIAIRKNNAQPAEDNLEQEAAPPQERAKLRSRLTNFTRIAIGRRRRGNDTKPWLALGS
jgi:hypothetical protein